MPQSKIMPPRGAGLARRRWIGAVLGALIALAPAAALRAETAPPAPATAETPEQVWTAEALDKLTARIALYPDALVAQILPAATFPLQVVEAARWLEARKSIAEGDTQAWDPSVKALLRYPTVLRMMSDDLRWTDELGAAFAAQPEDVLKAIQRLRRTARALGNLKPTPRQRVIVDPDSVIVIAPPEAEPDVIYVPIYDPEMVFFEPPPPTGMWISFDVGFPLGIWIGTGVSWSSWHVVHGGWGYDWGWGSVYGGCCRGAVYTYTPTIYNRRLTTDRARVWRPQHVSERRRPSSFRTPSFRSPAPRLSPGDISRGRLPPRTAPTPTPRRDTRTPQRPHGFTNIQRAPNVERNVQRGRESLRRTPTVPRRETQPTTPPARWIPPASRTPERRDRTFTPRTQTPSPSFTPRPQPDTKRFTTRGNESRSTMQPRTQAPRIQTPTPPQRIAPHREAPKTSAPAAKPGSAPAPQQGERRRR